MGKKKEDNLGEKTCKTKKKKKRGGGMKKLMWGKL